MSTQEGPRTDKVRKTESQSVLQLRESAVTITQTNKQENDKKEQEIIWSNTYFVLIKKKKKSKKWERKKELKYVLLKKRIKIKAGLPLTQSPPLIMISLLSHMILAQILLLEDLLLISGHEQII